MKLIKVSARGLKGLAFTLDLQSINFFIGSNFRGKSARSDAVRLVLLGFLPELGKTNAATFKLCNGKELVVDGEFDNGQRLSRRWFLKGDAVKYEQQVPPAFEGDNPVLAAMLDANVYFGLSERERVAYVAANVPGVGGEATPATIVANLQEALAGEELPAENQKKFIGALIEAENAAASADQFTEWTAGTFLDFALEFATEEGKRAKEFAIRMDKTAAGLAYLRTQDVAPVDLASLDAKRPAIEQAIEVLRNEKAKHHAAHVAQLEQRKRREALTRDLAARPALVSKRDRAAADLERLTGELAAMAVIEHKDVDELRLELRSAESSLAELNANLRQVEEGITRNERELGELGGKKTCPYCGAAGDGWKALKEGEIKSALDGLRVKRDQLGSHRTEVKTHADNIGRRISNMRTAQDLRAAKEKDIANARVVHAEAERALSGFTAKAEELERIPQADPAVAEAVEKAQAGMAAKQEELAQIDRQRTAAMGRSAELKRLADAEGERDKARVDELVAKSAANSLRERKAKMVADAFVPLLTIANAIFGSVLLTPIGYHDGEIGTWREGAWVSHKTFSGTEKALVYAAIQAALAARSPVRLMVIDELNKIDAANADKFLGCVERAIEDGRIDQFVGVDTAARYSVSKGGQVLTVS